MSLLGAVGVLFLFSLIFVFTPLIVWKVRRDTMPDSTQGVPMILCGVFKRELRQAIYGSIDKTGAVELPERPPWFRGSRLGRRSEGGREKRCVGRHRHLGSVEMGVGKRARAPRLLCEA